MEDKTTRSSVRMTDELRAELKKSGLTMVGAIKKGLEVAPAADPLEEQYVIEHEEQRIAFIARLRPENDLDWNKPLMQVFGRAYIQANATLGNGSYAGHSYLQLLKVMSNMTGLGMSRLDQLAQDYAPQEPPKRGTERKGSEKKCRRKTSSPSRRRKSSPSRRATTKAR